MRIFKALAVISLLFSLISQVNGQIVRIESKIGPDKKTGLSTGFFIDASTIIATDHSVSIGEVVTLHSVIPGPVAGTIVLKELGKATVVYECEGAEFGQMDDVAILKFDPAHGKVKNPLNLSPAKKCEGVICVAPGFPAGKPNVLNVIGHANRQTSIGDVYDFKVLKGSPLCEGGCSGSPAQSLEMGGYVMGMISRQTDGGTTAVCIPAYIIKKHLDAYIKSLE